MNTHWGLQQKLSKFNLFLLTKVYCITPTESNGGLKNFWHDLKKSRLLHHAAKHQFEWKPLWKGYPSLYVIVLKPHWHTSVWQWRVAQTDSQAARKRISAICVRHQRKRVCRIYRSHWARGRGRERGKKNAYGVKEASRLVSVSFIFLYFTLCQCLRISFWQRCISSAGCLSVFPQMRQMTMTAQPFLYHR